METTATTENKYYVYAYLDPRKPGNYIYHNDTNELKFDLEPIYVGKGYGRRSNEHIWEAKKILKENIKLNDKLYDSKSINWKKVNKILKIYRDTGRWPEVIILKNKMSEDNALSLEEEYVKLVGRLNVGTGPLTNIREGGSGKSPSAETRKRLSDFNLGKKLSEETKQKMTKTRSEGTMWMTGKKGKDCPNFGLKRSKESIQKMSESKMGDKNPMFGKEVSEETREKRSKSLLGENNPNYGKSMSEETKNKIRETKRKNKKTKNKIKETKIKNKKAKKIIPQKIFKVIGPTGTEYIVTGTMKQIQKQYNNWDICLCELSQTP